MRSARRSSRRPNSPPETKKIDIPLGSEYDLTINMNDDFVLTAEKVHALDLNVSDRKSYALATSRSKTSHAANRAASQKASQRQKIDLSDALIEGVNEPSIHRVGAVTARSAISSRAPVALSRFDSSLRLPDAGKLSKMSTGTRTARPDFPNGHVQTYVFGFDNPQPYIPRPFVSTHRPKSARPKTSHSRRMNEVPEFKLTSRLKLSSRREVPLKESKLTNSVVFGSFDSLMKEEEKKP